MRILFLTSRFPLPVLKGDKLRSWQFLRKLASENSRHEVTLLSYISRQEEYDLIPEVEKFCRVETVPFNNAKQTFSLLGGLASGNPYQVHLFESPGMKKLVNRHIPETDVIHLSTLRMAGNLPRNLPCSLVVDFVDSLSLNFKRRADNAPVLSRGLFLNESERLLGYESRLVEAADLSLAVGPVDAGALGKKVRIVPNSINPDTFYPPENLVPRRDLIFTGNMRYGPNVEASVFMAREILPIVIRKYPDIKLKLAGIDPAQSVKALRSRNVEITGFIDSVADELRCASVAVAPMVSGTGLQNKILEAMACGTPVVSTKIGNSGIRAEDGRDILIADTPELFAAHIINLLNDPALASRIGNAGRNFVETNFSWDSVQKILLDCYSTLANHDSHIQHS